MKRLIAAVIGMCIVGSVLAQNSFTIVRPADNSRVREKIRVLIPKNSIDEREGSYIGVFLGGKFLEATVPPVEGNYRVYTLDTKARQIPDGELKLELVKYVSFEDQPRIVDRSSVTVTVGNQMSIPIAAGGVKLRYAFTPGRQYVYRVEETVSVSTITGLDNSRGGRPAELPSADLKSRMMYAVDNRYGNGEALLRMQMLPDKGKDYAIMLLSGEAEPRRVDETEMARVYLRVSPTGRPVFGAIPAYFGFAQSGNGGTFLNVFSVSPLPVLPEKAVRPGSSWNAAYILPADVPDDKLWEANRVTQSFPARGEFVAAEWEMGHPCAKIRNSIAAGTRSYEGIKLEKAGRAFGDDKVSLDETIWFALDSKVILKRVRTIQIDQKVKADDATGVGNPGMGAPGNNDPTMPSIGPGGKKGPGGAGAGFTGPVNNRQGTGVGIGPAGGKGRGGDPAQQQPGQRGQNRTGGGGSRVQYIRQRYQQTFVLEQ